jgi:Do/DeqQ family serine protease
MQLKKGRAMKFRFIPTVLTASITSVITLTAVSHIQNKPHFGTAAAGQNTSVNFAALSSNSASAGMPVNFEAAAGTSVKAVVHINTQTKGRVVAEANGDMDDIFSQLFGRRQYYIPPQKGSGSGVVISSDGYIVTNNHVIADANDVTVTFNDRYTAKAKVVGTDPSTDIAVLKVEGEKNMPYLEFGNSDDVKLGQWVLAVGYPLTLDATVTAGIISAKGRSLGINKTQSASAIESFIQTDAAVNPGNSGGALVNTAGQLIGINSAIASPTGSYAGYSYAIPANIVRKAVNDLVKYGSVQRGYLGIQFLEKPAPSGGDVENTSNDAKLEGVYVMNVMVNSGAAKAGIKKGDVITQVNGIAVNNQPELQGQIARYQPGDNISIVYSRGGKSYAATVQLTNLNGTTDIIKPQSATKLLGATVRSLNEKEKRSYNQPGGVMVTDVGNGAIAKETQMAKGFVITGINNVPVSTPTDIEQAIATSKNVQISGFYPGRSGMYYYGLNNLNMLATQE